MRSLLAVSLLLIASTLHAQVKPRVVDLGRQYENQPLKILGCQIGQLSFADCTRIEADDDWWQHLKLVVKNVSSRTIASYDLGLFFEKQATVIGLQRAVGQPPPVDANGNETWTPAMRVAPGEVATFITQKYEGGDLDAVDKVRFVVTSVNFTDGSEWFFDHYQAAEAGQADDLSRKRFNYEQRYRVEPIAITGIEANGKRVAANEDFSTMESEWLRNLGITFRNKSDKAISCLAFSVMVLEGHPIFPPQGFTLSYGCSSVLDKKRNVSAVVGPGDSATAAMEPEVYDRLKQAFPDRESMAERTTVRFTISEVFFTDGTRYQ